MGQLHLATRFDRERPRLQPIATDLGSVFLGRCAQRGDACLGDGVILVNLAATDADRADDLVLVGQRNSTWKHDHPTVVGYRDAVQGTVRLR
jgi:hypothetical protein